MFADIVINGLVAGGMYAILAVGFSLIFGVARILNMAHTGFYMLTAFFVFIGSSILGFPLLLSLVAAIAAATVMAVLCFIFLFDRVKEHDTTVMIISVALAMLFQELLLLAFGGHFRGIPPFVEGFIEIFDISVSYQHLFAIGSTGLSLIGLWLLLTKTKLGNAIRAVSQDREIAYLMGIDVSRIFMIVMAISVVLAGLAGAVVAPIYMVSPLMWVQPLTIILAAVVLGGLGSIGGCLIGSLILGYTETIVTFLVPGGSFLRGAVSLSIMVAVLLVRPEGLFGTAFEEERL
ncbi:MAG: branched-chain amino acid ABC transporter permease [Desulfatiglans sp.]|jgi:branched-chain amino acid transport system permease protein|nr:branched-chain amino acid ABC transporter permease [Thermodesulfobacteriota bacterium]MEE4351568.1 branched-chain amino acid ABC transporter permease [Desulfatiglans sp.]